MEITFEIDLESLLRRISKNSSNYPPYDFIRLVEGEHEIYLLEIAVAGFRQEELTVEQVGDCLYVTSQCQPMYDENQFIHKGIARRNFRHIFRMSEELLLQQNIQLQDGLLRVMFLRKAKKTENRKLLPINQEPLKLPN